MDTDQGKEEFKKFNKESIINGYEGVMIKDPQSFYECKRSTSWLKSKPFIEISLEVVNYEEGTGRNQGKLGALIAEGEDDGKFFKLNIGSGFSDSQREEYWKKKDELKGKLLKLEQTLLVKVKMVNFGALDFQDSKLSEVLKTKKKFKFHF